MMIGTIADGQQCRAGPHKRQAPVDDWIAGSTARCAPIPPHRSTGSDGGSKAHLSFQNSPPALVLGASERSGHSSIGTGSGVMFSVPLCGAVSVVNTMSNCCEGEAKLLWYTQLMSCTAS